MYYKNKNVSIKTIKKKGGIIIKRKIFLITLLCTIIFSVLNVHAETASFFEAEYIRGIYESKYMYSNNTIYYQTARFFRKSDTHMFAYCIEPFTFFNEGSTYESTINPNNLTNEQKDRISKIAHFGFYYKNHTDDYWYAVTQMMIWQVADTTNGETYFTDKLNGNRVNIYQNEINEINNLVNNYNTLPKTNNKTYIFKEGEEIKIDAGDIISYYKSNDERVKIEGNNLIINNLPEGEYSFTLERNDINYNRPTIFYQSNNSQNIMESGDLEPIKSTFKIKVINTEININKIDSDTKSIIPSGDASLDGAIYTLYDNNMNIIKDLTIENNTTNIKSLDLGKYYLKEKSPGTGYNLDDKTYEITLDENNTKKELILENKVIKKNIIIKKLYGDYNQLNNEKNIDFEIYNSKNELIKTISTDENGEVVITLPYGEYKLIQLNSTNGYQKIDPFIIKVTNNEDETIELKDYKIPVPNTHTNNSLILYLIRLLLLIC